MVRIHLWLYIVNIDQITDQLTIDVVASKLENLKGGTVTFRATASGINTNNDIFRYQWMKRGSSDLPDKVLGVNGTMLTIPNVTESDEGQYYCTVTNEWNRSVESNDINFTVYGMYITYIYIYVYICDPICKTRHNGAY